MAIKLYRAGNKNIVRGIDCEIRLFDNHNPLQFVGIDGWCLKPEDINILGLNPDEINKSNDEWADYTPEQIRELAKASNINGWEKKRIATLKELISGQSA